MSLKELIMKRTIAAQYIIQWRYVQMTIFLGGLQSHAILAMWQLNIIPVLTLTSMMPRAQQSLNLSKKRMLKSNVILTKTRVKPALVIGVPMTIVAHH